MTDSPTSKFEHTIRRIAALFDGSAWTLIFPALVGLWLLDPPMVKTLGQWSLYFLVLAGFVVIISRVIFPQIRLVPLLKEVENGNAAAGFVVAAMVMFVALMVLSFVLWARPVGT